MEFKQMLLDDVKDDKFKYVREIFRWKDKTPKDGNIVFVSQDIIKTGFSQYDFRSFVVNEDEYYFDAKQHKGILQIVRNVVMEDRNINRYKASDKYITIDLCEIAAFNEVQIMNKYKRRTIKKSRNT